MRKESHISHFNKYGVEVSRNRRNEYHEVEENIPD